MPRNRHSLGIPSRQRALFVTPRPGITAMPVIHCQVGVSSNRQDLPNYDAKQADSDSDSPNVTKIPTSPTAAELPSAVCQKVSAQTFNFIQKWPISDFDGLLGCPPRMCSLAGNPALKPRANWAFFYWPSVRNGKSVRTSTLVGACCG